MTGIIRIEKIFRFKSSLPSVVQRYYRHGKQTVRLKRKNVRDRYEYQSDGQPEQPRRTAIEVAERPPCFYAAKIEQPGKNGRHYSAEAVIHAEKIRKTESSRHTRRKSREIQRAALVIGIFRQCRRLCAT